MNLDLGTLSVAVGVDLTDVAKAGPRLQEIGSAAASLGQGLTVGVTLPIIAAGAAAAKFATDFNVGLANVAALMPGATGRVRELGDAVLDMSVRTGQSTKNLTEGLYQTVSAFGDTADTARILEINARSAAAGLATTTDAINLTSSVTKAYGVATAEGVQHASDLAQLTVRLGQTTFPELAASIGKVTPLAAALSVSQEELFGTMATFTGVTGGAAEVATQFRGVLQALMAPTAETSALFKQMGVASGEALIEQRGLQGAITALVDAAAASGAPLQKFIGSVEGQTLALAATQGQADAYTQKLAEMASAAGATDAAFKAQTEGVNAAGFQFQQLKLKLEQVLITFGNELLPTFALVVQGAMVVANVIGDGIVAFGKLPGPVKAAAGAIVLLVAALGPMIAAVGGALAVYGALLPVMGTVTAVVSALAPPVAIAAAAFVALVAVGTAVAQNWDAIRTRAQPLVDGVVAIAKAVVNFELALGNLVLAVADVTGVLDVARGAFRIASDVIVGTVTNIKDIVVDAVHLILFSFGGLRDLVGLVAPSLNAVTGLFQKLSDVLVGHSIVPDMVEAIGGEFEQLEPLMVSPAQAAADKVNAAFKSIANPEALRALDFDVSMDASQLYAAVIAGGEQLNRRWVELGARTQVASNVTSAFSANMEGALAEAAALAEQHQLAAQATAAMRHQQEILASIVGTKEIPARNAHNVLIAASSAQLSGLNSAAGALSQGITMTTRTVAEDASFFSKALDAAGGAVRAQGDGMGSTFSKLGGGALDLLSKFSPMGIAMQVIQKVMEKLEPAINALEPIVTILADAIAAGLMPILKSLFPVIKLIAIAFTYAGEIVYRVAQGFLLVIGNVVRAIGKLIDALPFVSGKGIIAAGEGLLDQADAMGDAARAMGEARDQLRELEWPAEAQDAANQQRDSTDAVKESVDLNTEQAIAAAEVLRESAGVLTQSRDILLEILAAELGTARAVLGMPAPIVNVTVGPGGAVTSGPGGPRTSGGGGGGFALDEALSGELNVA